MQAESDGLNKRIANLERAILRRKVARRTCTAKAYHINCNAVKLGCADVPASGTDEVE